MNDCKTAQAYVSMNSVLVSGNVTTLNKGKTAVDVPAVSLVVALAQRNGETIFARVNAYGRVALCCCERLKQKDYVVILGELMDRKRSNKDDVVMEIRAKDIWFGPASMVKISG